MENPSNNPENVEMLLGRNKANDFEKPDPEHHHHTNANASANTSAQSQTHYSVSSSYAGGFGYGYCSSPVKIQRAKLTYDPEPRTIKEKVKKEYQSTDDGNTATLITDTIDRERISRRRDFELKTRKKLSNEGNDASKPAIIPMVKSKTTDSIIMKQFSKHQGASQSSASTKRSKSTPRSNINSDDIRKESSPRKRFHSEKPLSDVDRKKLEKAEIQKRLDQLKKSTKEILQKSIRNKTSRMGRKGKIQKTEQSSPMYSKNFDHTSFSSKKAAAKSKDSTKLLDKTSTNRKPACKDNHYQMMPKPAESSVEKKEQNLLNNETFFIPLNSKGIAKQKQPNRNGNTRKLKTKSKESSAKPTSPSGQTSNCSKRPSNYTNETKELISKDSQDHSSQEEFAVDQPSSFKEKSKHIKHDQQSSLNTKNSKAESISLNSHETPGSKFSQEIPLSANSKRIGLLRKPECRDHSYSAIKDYSFDKENVAREMLTVNVVNTVKSVNSNKNRTPSENKANLQTETSHIKETKVTFDSRVIEIENSSYTPETLEETQPIIEQKTPTENLPPSTSHQDPVKENVLNLEVPDAHLVSKVEAEIKSKPINEIPTNPNDPSQLAFWLKPSAVHVFPYNFIVAVRRKLEAYANGGSHTHLTATKCVETSTRKLILETNENTFEEKCKHHNHHHSISKNNDKKAPNNRKEKERKCHHNNKLQPKPCFDYNSITSDLETTISMTHQSSNLVSQQPFKKSSLESLEDSRIETNNDSGKTKSKEEDTTTISSSVFGSPDKKSQIAKDFDYKVPRPLSPLCVDKIEHLQIKPRKSLETAINNHQIETKRGHRYVLQNESIGSTRSSLSSSEKRDKNSVNVNQFLEDFNRSLSQVIEVNELLKSSLDKSTHYSPGRSNSKHNTSTQKDYSNDFEDSTQQTKSSSLHNAKELDRISEKNSPEANDFPNEDTIQFNLGIKSISNSSNLIEDEEQEEEFEEEEGNIDEAEIVTKENSSQLSKNTHETFVEKPFEYEQQLSLIDQFKNQLKSNILASQQARLEDTHNSSFEKEIASLKKRHKNSENPHPDFSNVNQEFEKHLESIQQVKTKLKESIKKAQSDFKDFIHSSPLENKQPLPEVSPCPSNSEKLTYTKCPNKQKIKGKTRTLTKGKTSINNVVHKKIENHSTENNVHMDTASQISSIQSELQEGQNQVTDKSITEDLQSYHESPTTSNGAEPTIPSPDSLRRSFIESHVNCSRGDYPENDTSQMNEAQFQDAIHSFQQNSAELNQVHLEASPPSSSSCNNSTVAAPLSYVIPENQKGQAAVSENFHPNIRNTANESVSRLSNEIIARLNQSDIELSYVSSRQSSVSESSVNYSCVGMYEKLIRNEISKSEYLLALLKMRERALLDRTKGQLAWLQVQKERYKSRGLLMHITEIRKKQRGILLKMEKEREEIKKLLQQTTKSSSCTESSSVQKSPSKRRHRKDSSSSYSKTTSSVNQKPPTVLPAPPSLPLHKSLRSSSRHSSKVRSLNSSNQTETIVRANYELEPSKPLENLLLKREADLKKRREHVERLMLWHQKLDQEEAEVYQLEQKLFDSNTMLLCMEEKKEKPLVVVHLPEQQFAASSLSHIASGSSEQSIRSSKMERRLRDIDKTLQELQHISGMTTSNRIEGGNNLVVEPTKDYVRTTGSKLNKLWRRLTSQQIEKFEPNRRYKLCKSDLENLYEEAKIAVIEEFNQNEKLLAAALLERSSNASILSQNSFKTDNSPSISHCSKQSSHSTSNEQMPTVPELNLTSSTNNTQSDRDEFFTHPINATEPQGTYSPSAAEQDFHSSSHSMVLDDAAIQEVIDNADINNKTFNLNEQNEREKTARIKRNVDKFLQLTYRLNAEQTNLHRSHSDPSLNEPSASIISLRNSQMCSNMSTNSLNSGFHPATSTKESSRNQPSISLQSTLETKDSSSLKKSQEILPQSYHTNYPTSSILSSDGIYQTSVPSKAVSPSTSTQDRPSVICSVDSVGNVSETNKSNSLAPTQTSSPNLSKSSSSCMSSSSLLTHERYESLKQLSEESENKAREISEKLSEISVAVLNLGESEIQSSPNYNNIKISNPIQEENIRESISPESIDMLQLSQNSDNSSYSNEFEKASSDLISPSGCSLRKASQTTSSPISANLIPSKISKSVTEKSEQNSSSNAQQKSSNSEAPDISIDSVLNTGTTKPSSFQNQSSNYIAVTSSAPCRLEATTQLPQSPIKQTLSYRDYEPDFESSSELSQIENISFPNFDSSMETSSDDGKILDESLKSFIELENNSKSPRITSSPTSKKEISSKTSSNLDSNDSRQNSEPLAPLSPPMTSITSTFIGNQQGSNIVTSVPVPSSQINDIIKETDKHPQLVIDTEQLKHYEHIKSVPYVYVREIPNKPPPPYVPPAHGSPMTTIFPSEERIKDITFRRTHELYCNLIKTDYVNEKGEKIPSVLSEKITNIYERIVLDICREYLEENQEIIRKGDPHNFHNQLAFFNPPNRLRCIQDRIYKEVRRSLAMDKTPPKRSQTYSIYGARAKRDHIGKIIIQEMYDEDELWCNFHREEREVIDLILDEMVDNESTGIIKEICEEADIPFVNQKTNYNDVGYPVDESNSSFILNDMSSYHEDNEMEENLQNNLNESRFQENHTFDGRYISSACTETEILEISGNFGSSSGSYLDQTHVHNPNSAEES